MIGAARASSSTRACARCAPEPTWSPRPRAAASAPAPPCSRSTRRPAACARCATGSRSPPRTSSSPSRCPTCSTSSAGPAAVDHRLPHVRALLPHHERRPDRLRLGRWAFAFGARLGGASSATQDVERTGGAPRGSSRSSRAGAIAHAWGGPIDVSPSHLPQIGTLDGGRVHYAFGFTGNGVGPSHLAGRDPRRPARRAMTPGGGAEGRRPRPSRPSRSRGAGGMVVRARVPAQGAHRGRGPAAPTRSPARSDAAPKALGIHVSR